MAESVAIHQQVRVQHLINQLVSEYHLFYVACENALIQEHLYQPVNLVKPEYVFYVTSKPCDGNDEGF